MITTCEQCQTSFSLDEALIGKTGSKVRCSVCKHIYTVLPPAEPEMPIELEEQVPTPESEKTPEGLDLETDMAEVESMESHAGPNDLDAPAADAIDSNAGDDMEAALKELEQNDFDFDSEFDVSSKDLEPEMSIESEEIDLSELENILDQDDTPPPAPSEEEPEELEFDFDAAQETVKEPVAAEAKPTEVEAAEPQELDLALTEEESADLEDSLPDLDDLDLEFEGDVSGVEETDIAESDLELEIEPEDSELAETADLSVAEDQLDDIDDLDLELEPADEAEPSLSEVNGDDTIEDIEELDIELESDMEAVPTMSTPGDDDAIEDISDLDLEVVEDLASSDSDDTLAEPDGLEELDLSDIEDISDEELEPIEDLLDESETEEASPVAALEENLEKTDELDLSDIEKILDAEDAGALETDADEPEELEFDMDFEAEEGDSAPAGPVDDFDATEELDLSDIERMIEEEGQTAAADIVEEEADDFELELDLEPEIDDIEEATADDAAQPQEIEDIFEEPGGDEVDLELEADDDAEALLADEPEEEYENLEEVEDFLQYDDEAVEDEPPVKQPGAAPVDKPKKRVRPPLLILLVLLLLVGGVVGLNSMGIKIPFVSDIQIPFLSSIKIPFISDLLGPKVEDPGNLRIYTSDIVSRFVDNPKAGKLFIVRGKVRNGYSEPRSFIRLSAKLYSEGKKLVKTKQVFCGNVLSDLQLQSLSIQQINKKLNNRLGHKRANVDVPPGKSIPFMVVFSNLPANLEEYTIEAESSTGA